MDARPEIFSDETALADQLIEQLAGNIVLALPLGLGKANLVANALYARAAADPSISLTILTALTLETPHGSARLEQRFIDPIRKRIFGNYPDPVFAAALRHGSLPSNIAVFEFFLPAGRWLGVPVVQQNYIASNYTHAARTLLDRGLNVVAQMVARNNERISLSCNTDLTPDLLQARQAGTADFLFVGEVNPSLPVMYGDAERPMEDCDYLLEGPHCSYPLFAPPKPAVTMADYAAGFWIARLIQDGGTLQIGIGSIGDAVAQALILRHRHNPLFREIVLRLSAKVPQTADLMHDTPFMDGLFGLSEMLVDSFLPLIDAGVVKREVDGALIEAACFLGPAAFYDRLINMSETARQKIRMKPVSWVNSLYRDEDKKRKQRTKARFVNNAMMATLLGAVVSDSLEDGRVVSGVGGQYDFVAQAFALDGARSVIALNSTRVNKGRARSNILWSYGNQTIPRHLRDIIVTEYGVADLRGKTDAEVIAAMLAISDSRFQDELLAQAKQAGKIDTDYEIPVRFRDNTPKKIEEIFDPAKNQGHLPPYPFGSDFTDIEQRLIPALQLLKNTSSSRYRLGRNILRGLKVSHAPYIDHLQRLGLLKPNNPVDWAYRFLILDALEETSRGF
jgi:hypothetical protein